jgi:hypothetical protein
MSFPSECQVPAPKRRPPHLAQRDPLLLEFAAGVLVKKIRALARAPCELRKHSGGVEDEGLALRRLALAGALRTHD